MPLLRVAPGIVLNVGQGKFGAWAQVPAPVTSGGGGGGGTPTMGAVAGAVGWWNAGTLAGVAASGGGTATAWGVASAGLVDQSGSNNPLAAYSAGTLVAPQPAPRLNGLLGGIGGSTQTAPQSGNWTLCYPTMSLDQGFRGPSINYGSSQNWSIFLSWSRPNWPVNPVIYSGQNRWLPNVDVPLVTVGGLTILKLTGTNGANLVLFPFPNQTTLSTTIERRHTHTLLLVNGSSGISAWLDGVRVANNVANPLAQTATGPVTFLHSTAAAGGAGCWLHEAAVWQRTLSSTDITTAFSAATAWKTGPRRSVQILVNGQSNAGYSIDAGAWQLLAQGIAWHLGAISYGVIANWGITAINGESLTGNPLTGTSNGAGGSWLNDPQDGSDPAGWSYGTNGTNEANFLAGSTLVNDLQDICAIFFAWGESDSLRAYSEKTYINHAYLRLASLLRGTIGKTIGNTPLFGWSSLPFLSGTDAGQQMIREMWYDIASVSGNNAHIIVPNTANSLPRGGTETNPGATPWILSETGGDTLHRDNIDFYTFARAAPLTAARAILASSGGDTISAIPSTLPSGLGPSVTHAYQAAAHSTTIIATITHDGGTDLVLPGYATSGRGWRVLDGTTSQSPGTPIYVTSASRIDATHIQLTLQNPPTNAQPGLTLYYIFGVNECGRGDVVTDNYATVSLPAGWDIGADLGSSWRVNQSLQCTPYGVPVSTTPT